MQLKDKVAIITGASSGIGQAAALLFAEQGARLVLAARGKDRLDALAAQIRQKGGEAVALAGDVREEAFARALVDTARAGWGGLDIAFNNAGTLRGMGETTAVAAEDWQYALDTNLTSAFYAAKHQLPAMLGRTGASLIFTSSFVGHTAGMPGAAAYAASKAGLVGLTQALATEFGPRGIRVNALLPGGTDTPLAREMNSTPEALAGVANLHALKRMAEPAEIAQAALFLASAAASFVTGSAMLVDGGVSINRT